MPSLILTMIFLLFAFLTAVVTAVNLIDSDASRAAVFVPAGNGSIDRHALEQLRPSTAPTVLYSEEPHSDTITITKFTTHKPVVLLENSGLWKAVNCAKDQSSVTLTDATSFALALDWPKTIWSLSLDTLAAIRTRREVFSM